MKELLNCLFLSSMSVCLDRFEVKNANVKGLWNVHRQLLQNRPKNNVSRAQNSMLLFSIEDKITKCFFLFD